MATDHIEDRGPAVFAVTTATLALASCLVAARLVCRAGIVHNLSWDDLFIVLAWVLAFGLSFSIDFGTRKGLGLHDSDIPLADWDALRRCEYAFSVLYNPALMATKTSILVFFLRLSKNTEKVLRIGSWVVLAVVNVAGVVLTFLNIFQCQPTRAAFDIYDGQAECIPLLTEFICSAPVNIVTDLAILALPMPILTGMRLPRRQKSILVFTFGLGIFVAIVDVVRIFYLQHAITHVSPSLSSNPAATFGDSPDFAFNASLSLMWSAVEVNIGVACACIPTLKPLIIRILPSMIVNPDATSRSSDRQETKPRSMSGRHTSDDSGHAADVSPTTAQAPSPQIPPYAATRSPGNAAALDFLTTPDMAVFGPSSADHSQTLSTNATGGSGRHNVPVYFGFVNIKQPRSIIRTTIPDSFRYCTLVAILFFLWGFSYGLLNTLNNAIATVAHMTVAEAIGLTSMYFGGGYFFGPLLVGGWMLRHDEHQRSRRSTNGSQPVGGFKATFMVGLCIYGTGTIMFWPSAVLRSFPGFMISAFVVGFGLSVLETAANPFLVLCGPMDYAEMRLLLAQSVQGIATTLSQLLAQRVFFIRVGPGSDDDSLALLDVQWTYLAITLFSAALALFFYYIPLPEVTDAEMEKSTRYLPVDPKMRSFGGLQLRTCTLALAVMAQWTAIAGQESMSIFFDALLAPAITKSSDVMGSNAGSSQGGSPMASSMLELALAPANYLLIAHTAFTVSRFLAAYLAYLSPTHPRVPQPRTVLSIHTGLSIVCAALVASLRPQNQNLRAIAIILFFFFEGPLWPLIFALGLRGQGKHTKRASAWITMGGSGPAFWPFVMYGVKARGGSYQTAFAIVPALLVVTGAFSLFLDLKRPAQALVDARVGAEEQSRIQDRANRERELDTIMLSRRRSSLPQSADLPNFVKRLSMAISRAGRRRSSEQPTAEHRERRSGSG